MHNGENTTPCPSTTSSAYGSSKLRDLGQPFGTAEDLIRVAQSSQAEVGTDGRRLATRFGFEFPTALETTVSNVGRHTWQHEWHNNTIKYSANRITAIRQALAEQTTEL